MTNSGGPGKLMYYVTIGIIAVAVIWIFSIANNANNMASENAAAVQVPEYKIYYVAGGPERFASEFENAIKEVENVNQEDYLWSSIIVENDGERDTGALELNVTAAIPIEKVYFSTTDKFTGIEMSHEKNAIEATLTMKEFDKNESFIIFIGMLPPGYEKPFNDKKWVNEYQSYLEKVMVKSDMAEIKLYASGYVSLYEDMSP